MIKCKDKYIQNRNTNTYVQNWNTITYKVERQIIKKCIQIRKTNTYKYTQVERQIHRNTYKIERKIHTKTYKVGRQIHANTYKVGRQINWQGAKLKDNENGLC